MLTLLSFGLLVSGLTSPADAGPIRPTPLACNLRALGPAERERHERLRREVVSHPLALRRLPDGLEARYAPARERELGEWAKAERKCCPFLRITVTSRAEGAWLTVTGPPEVQELLQEVVAGTATP